jgi:hypothetical protein
MVKKTSSENSETAPAKADKVATPKTDTVRGTDKGSRTVEPALASQDSSAKPEEQELEPVLSIDETQQKTEQVLVSEPDNPNAATVAMFYKRLEGRFTEQAKQVAERKRRASQLNQLVNTNARTRARTGGTDNG